MQKEENESIREYQKLRKQALRKQQKITLGSIQKDEREHKSRLGRLLRRMKA